MVGIFGPEEPLKIPRSEEEKAQEKLWSQRMEIELAREKKLEARRTALLHSCAGCKLVEIENSFGVLRFKFDNGVAVTFDDGWATLTLGDEYNAGGFYTDRITRAEDKG